MEWRDGKLIIDAEFSVIQMNGEDYAGAEIVAPEGAIVWQHERGVVIWRNLRECARWGWKRFVVPPLVAYALIVMLGHLLKWVGIV